jgi:hypothetical protein
MTQHFGNHPHRPTQYFIAWGLMLAAVTALVFWLFGWRAERATVAFTLAAVGWLSYAARRGTTSLQDRVIKLEMRYRTDALLSADQRATFGRLSKPQIIALRFASDAELPALIERASREQLSGRAIKQAIVDWVPDWDRS